MENSKLQEDLLREFKEEKELINAQLALLDPLAVSLRKPVAARIWNSLVLVAFEALSWLGIATVISFCVIRDKVYPFYILARMRSQGARLGFSDRDMNNMYNSVIVFAVIICILLFIIARNLAKIRKKNNILQMAGKTIKTVVGEQLKRKAAINTIDQRHFGILEPLPIPETKATEVLNPGH
ncbi:MAG: hypothetical protein V4561_07325 [Bacteroidota bacterium]